jgi:simple sugar transport system permease protein
LQDIPVIGDVFFNHNVVVYLSFVLIFVSWLWIFKTPAGLRLQGIGERPEAAFARGINVNRMRYVYTVLGGALVGFAGGAYSLSVKLGWSHRHTAGNGWIALAIVIFGGMGSVKGALVGALIIGLTETLVAAYLAAQYSDLVAFALMIGILFVRPQGLFGEGRS